MFGAVALKALEVSAIPTPWLHQDTTTIALYGAYAAAPKTPRAPRPTYGQSKDGRDDLKQVLLSLGVSGDGGIPLRIGVRDGNRSDSMETPIAIEECLALGLDAYSARKLPLIPRQSCRSFHGKVATPEPNATQGITHWYREPFSPYEGGSDATPEVIDASDPRSVMSQMGGWAQ